MPCWPKWAGTYTRQKQRSAVITVHLLFPLSPASNFYTETYPEHRKRSVDYFFLPIIYCMFQRISNACNFATFFFFPFSDRAQQRRKISVLHFQKYLIPNQPHFVKHLQHTFLHQPHYNISLKPSKTVFNKIPLSPHSFTQTNHSVFTDHSD